MGKYKIAVSEAFTEHIVVEADSEEEAIEKALEDSHFADPQFEYVVDYPTSEEKPSE